MSLSLPSGSLPSVMKHEFSQVPKADIPRSQFNRSHGYKTTLDAGYLVPIYVDEALPGDTFNLKLTTFARLATPITPFIDNMYCDFFFFGVPIRLIWDNFKKFMGEQKNPGDSTSYTVPRFAAEAAPAVGSLHDYMGNPMVANALVNSLHHRAYNLIWNQWFRDQNLQDSVVVDTDDGTDARADYVLLKRGKRHDYFTSCLPWPQKGSAVTLPLGTTAPLIRNPSGTNSAQIKVAGSNTNVAAGTALAPGAAGILSDLATGTGTYYVVPNDSVLADLTNATAATINQLRQAFQVQKLLERDARGGTRYTEVILSHFGVTSPDARQQRAELLGMGTTPVGINAIPQTSSTDGTSPQGNLAAMGTFSHSGVGFTKSFTEHCVLLGLVSIRADLNYQQGLNRMFSRQTRYDFYWPALAHIGEQAVLTKEIYSDPAGGTDDVVFGYQERYAEYRYKPSVITGKLRSTASGTLDIWHLAQKFTSAPVLDTTFISESPPVARVVATGSSQPQFIFDARINLICARPMPTYSVPGLIDHF